MAHLPISSEEARLLLAPLASYPHLALAVSGGPDSVALLQLAARWRGELGSGPRLSVLTVDHGLRAGSREEAEMVGRMADSLGLAHAILAWKHEGSLSAGIQSRARTARYDLMTAYCHEHDIPALVTAHHLDDQAETFLMRLKRGSGLDGLAAIPETGVWAGITILRPLLDVPKARLVATLADRGIAFVTDPSNEDARFERVRVRGSAEALARLGLTQEALALSARRLRRARAALDQTASSFLAAHSETSEAGYAAIDRQALEAAPEEVALRALSRLIEAIGGREEQIRLAKLEELLASLRADPAKRRTLGRCRIEPLAGRLGIFREIRAKGLPIITLDPGARTLWDNRFKVELGTSEAAPITIRALGDAGSRDLRAQARLDESLPLAAARALPGCWRGEVLLGVPALGRSSPLHREKAIDCRALFVWAGAPGDGEHGLR